MKRPVELAVILPAYNEAAAIGRVVNDIRRVLPEAVIVVVDNRSTDQTTQLALEAIGASAGRVIEERTPGKARAVRRAFLEVDARYYVMCDADDTYPAEAIPALLDAVRSGRCDMAIGNRHADGGYAGAERRRFHGMGNRLIAGLINFLFKGQLEDVLSGLRVFSRRFVRNYPIIAHGFALEVDMTAYALDRHFRILEFPIAYRKRPPGSHSKLRTIPDGMRVLVALFNLFRFYRPLRFFGSIGLVLLGAGALAGAPIVTEFIRTGLVPRFPTALLATGLGICSVLAFAIGLILDGLRHHQQLQTERDLLHDSDNHD